MVMMSILVSSLFSFSIGIHASAKSRLDRISGLKNQASELDKEADSIRARARKAEESGGSYPSGSPVLRSLKRQVEFLNAEADRKQEQAEAVRKQYVELTQQHEVLLVEEAQKAREAIKEAEAIEYQVEQARLKREQEAQAALERQRQELAREAIKKSDNIEYQVEQARWNKEQEVQAALEKQRLEKEAQAQRQRQAAIQIAQQEYERAQAEASKATAAPNQVQSPSELVTTSPPTPVSDEDEDEDEDEKVLWQIQEVTPSNSPAVGELNPGPSHALPRARPQQVAEEKPELKLSDILIEPKADFNVLPNRRGAKEIRIRTTGEGNDHKVRIVGERNGMYVINLYKEGERIPGTFFISKHWGNKSLNIQAALDAIELNNVVKNAGNPPVGGCGNEADKADDADPVIIKGPIPQKRPTLNKPATGTSDCVVFDDKYYTTQDSSKQMAASINRAKRSGTSAKKKRFLELFSPLALEIQTLTGWPASVSLAQMALETNWGTSNVFKRLNNFGGHSCFEYKQNGSKPLRNSQLIASDLVKSGALSSATRDSQGRVRLKSPCTYKRPRNEGGYYRSFSSVADGAFLYADNVLENKAYKKSQNYLKAQLRAGKPVDPAKIVDGLRAYAADRKYRKSLMTTINANNLTRFDDQKTCQ
jgi:uncharacterized FlgJ-related protein